MNRRDRPPDPLDEAIDLAAAGADVHEVGVHVVDGRHFGAPMPGKGPPVGTLTGHPPVRCTASRLIRSVPNAMFCGLVSS